MSTIKIKNDQDAIDLLHRLLAHPEVDVPNVEFENWPRFEMHVKGDRYHSTITPELMRSFLELQKTINMSFALVRYSDSSRRLKDSDREELKILVSVEEGSSGFVALLEEQVGAIAAGVAEGFKNMESRHKLIAILTIGAFAIGGYSFSTYIDTQKELRLAELKNIDNQAEREERIQTLSIFKEVSAESTAAAAKTAGLYEDVVEIIPQILTISEHMAKTYDKFLASTVDAKYITVQGTKVPGPVINEISQVPRNTSVDDRYAGVFLIRGVDHSLNQDYRFKLYDVTRKTEITATLPKDGSFVTDHILDLIQAAEWGHKVVLFQLRIKTRSGKVVSAEIEKVTEITNQEIYEDKLVGK